MAEVHLNGAQKTYPNGFEAIPGIDLEIADGEFLVLVGPSGCGKSTLLRMVAGLERVTGGAISIGERVVNEVEPADRNIAMVFQNYALYPHMSVYRNMAYGLRNRGTPKQEIDRRVREASRILELEPLLDRKPRQLSGGQRQRVAMGRAIVREPDVFLFDEPLSNLDAKLRVQMRVEIKKLQHRLGTTSIYVTHDQVEAMTMAHWLVLMNAGVAEQVGTPMEVYSRPQTLFVASFIGSPSMNFLDGVVTADGQGVVLDGDRTIAVTGGSPGARVTVGIRPEHLKRSDDGELKVEVDVSEPLGAETLVHGHLQGVAAPLTVRLDDEQTIASGDILSVSPERGRVHVFEPDTGKRI